ncbi:unnamed protein product [Larinioides sclopetarius]|uniref:Glycine-rich protein n=1 Tax=Larinioides sclopetarius TaxID=280406 RepID=A0AAV1ZUC2_9ARAC
MALFRPSFSVMVILAAAMLFLMPYAVAKDDDGANLGGDFLGGVLGGDMLGGVLGGDMLGGVLE